MVFIAVLISWLALAPADAAPVVVQAPGSPIQLDHTKILNAGEQPFVLLYSATNLTNQPFDQFTVIVYVFREGVLKARQVAPARRTLDPHGSKYTAMVLDGFAIEPTDFIVVGVNQAQRVGSDEWWRAELQPLAEEAGKRPKALIGLASRLANLVKVKNPGTPRT